MSRVDVTELAARVAELAARVEVLAAGSMVVCVSCERAPADRVVDPDGSGLGFAVCAGCAPPPPAAELAELAELAGVLGLSEVGGIGACAQSVELDTLGSVRDRWVAISDGEGG